MICPKCGNQLNEGAAFCPKCGNKIGNNTTNYVPNQPMTNNAVVRAAVTETAKKKHSTWKTVLITVLVTIVAGFTGLMILGSKLADSETKEVSTSEESVAAEPGEASNAPEVSDPEAVKEYVGYIDQAAELAINVYNDPATLDTESDTSLINVIESMNVLLADLTELEQKADAVSGVDAKLENAGKEYFSMVYNSCRSCYDSMVFYSDFWYFSNFVSSRPNPASYDLDEDYLNDSFAWVEALEEAYASIDSCTPAIESEWKKFGDTLNLYNDIFNKQKIALQYNDYLRGVSSRYMTERVSTLLLSEIDKFSTYFGNELEHAASQVVAAFGLAEEIDGYAEMEQEERAAYEFENLFVGNINLDYDVIDTIYPSLYNTYDAFLIVKTGCTSGSRQVVVEAEIPGLTQTYKESFTLDPSYRTIYIKPPALTGELDLSSAKDAQLQVTVSDQDGTLIEAKTFPITIKSKYDVEWYTNEFGVATKDNILCFLTPESAVISELKRLAIDEMSDITNGTVQSFAGYHNNTPWENHVYTYLQATAIMRAMCDMGVRYNKDVFSISGSHQHVLFPEDVLEQKGGLCIETTLVVASALQSAGMHAFIVMPPGHAQVAVETWKGSGEYFLIETTLLSSNSNNQQVFVDTVIQLIQDNTLPQSGLVTYKNQEGWNDYLSVDGTYLIDCDDSRVLGLTPFAN